MFHVSKSTSVISNRICNLFNWKTYGVDLYGSVLHQSGIGDVNRAFERAFIDLSIPHTITPNIGTLKYMEPNHYPVNILIGDPRSHIYNCRLHAIPSHEYTIGVWFWELNNYFPWTHAYNYVDEIWCFSQFCYDTFIKFMPYDKYIPIRKLSYPIVGCDITNCDDIHDHYNIARDKFTFLFTFDFNGSIERKNPYAVIDAFNIAFNNDTNAQLIIKCMYGEQFEHELNALESYIASYHNIKIIHGLMSKSQILSLIRLSDCYVSLHRSEGLGIGMMEAMYLGKPVIATAYGGSMEFTRPDLCKLISYDMCRAGTSQCYYNPDAMWANPKVKEAAHAMLDVYKGNVAPSTDISNYIKCKFNQQIFNKQLSNYLNGIQRIIY